MTNGFTVGEQQERCMIAAFFEFERLKPKLGKLSSWQMRRAYGH
jgi:hypothetical protein